MLHSHSRCFIVAYLKRLAPNINIIVRLGIASQKSTKLLIENLRLIESSLATHATPQTAGAFQAKSKLQNRSKNQHKSTSDTSLTIERKEKRSCNYCKKFGHIIANCRKRIAAEQRATTANADNNNDNKNSNSSSKNNSKTSMFLATGLTVKTNFVSADSWISDSGTTHHMTANKQYFATFEKFSIPQHIETAGKECILAYGSGKVNVDVRIGNKWSSALLDNVWYMPDARHQLFSIRQAAKHGNEVIFDSDGVKIKCDRKIVATGKLEQSVYVMNMRVRAPNLQVEANLATTKDQLQGWHERLGH